jgi:hypothetical protein
MKPKVPNYLMRAKFWRGVSLGSDIKLEPDSICHTAAIILKDHYSA